MGYNGIPIYLCEPAMSVTVPDEVLRSAGLSEEEFQREVAILLFRQDRMTLAQAARFVRMDRLSFQRLLSERGICVHYDVEDFEGDLKTLRDLGRL